MTSGQEQATVAAGVGLGLLLLIRGCSSPPPPPPGGRPPHAPRPVDPGGHHTHPPVRQPPADNDAVLCFSCGVPGDPSLSEPWREAPTPGI